MRLRAGLALLVIFSAVASAAPIEDATGRARAHYEAGRALFSLGNYQDALREFTSGYQLAPKPRFLVNLGQTYRKLGQLDNAREMYQRFLQLTAVDDPDRVAVTSLLAEVEEQIRLEPVRQIDAPIPSPAPAAVPAVVEKPAPRPRFIRRHWWIIPTVVVVAAGIGVGIYFGVRSTQPDCGSVGLGCAYPDRK